MNGIILAGGKSLRMGTDKGLLKLHGQKLVNILADLLRPFVSDILIITSHPGYASLGYQVYSDLIPDKGPAGGILTGLHHSSENDNLILSCDTPFLTADFLKYLKDVSCGSPITVPVSNGQVHPLCGVYSKSISSVWEEKVKAGELKLTVLLEAFKVQYVDTDMLPQFNSQTLFRNLNTPEDLKGL
jgi:molybdopterin-guanine dinucleotide biosynthesis protein A